MTSGEEALQRKIINNAYNQGWEEAFKLMLKREYESGCEDGE